MEFNKDMRPKVGLAVYILNAQKQALFMLRSGKHAPGTWAPPGGHLEFGESFLDCASREIKEEVDLDISNITFLGITNDLYSAEKHYVTLAFLATEWKGEPKIMEPEKCEKLKWVDFHSLPSPLLLSVQNYFDQNNLCPCGSEKKFNDCHNFKS